MEALPFGFARLCERTCSESLNNKQEDDSFLFFGQDMQLHEIFKERVPFLFTVTAEAVEVPNHIKVEAHTKIS